MSVTTASDVQAGGFGVRMTGSLASAMLALASVTVGLSGCSLSGIASRTAASALGAGAGGSLFAEDDDPELVAAAAPFGLKVQEALLRSRPYDRELLLGAASGFTQYSYAFVQLRADELEATDVSAAYAQRDRARRLYIRARGYGLRALGLPADSAGPGARELAAMGRRDLPAMYWTAAAWLGAIALGKDEPALVGTFPGAQAVLERAAALDADAERGGLRTLLIAYEVSRPDAGQDALERARRHFARAVQLTEGREAGVFVAMAEAIAQSRGGKAEFLALLDRALALDPDAVAAARLANHVSQRRARWLRGQADELFPE